MASTLGVLGSVARKYAHKIPFIVKINHNELLTYPNKFDQTLFASVEQAFDMGAVAVGRHDLFRLARNRAARYRKSPRPSNTRMSWAWPPSSGPICATPPSRPTGSDYHVAADLTGQANHLAVTIQADIVKQKMAENNGGYNAIKFGKTSPKVYSELTDRPSHRPGALPGGELLHGPRRPDQLRRRVRARTTWQQAVRTAVINKRAGGMGLISGRKAFQRPMEEGVELLNAIQDVYLDEGVTIA